MCFAIMDGLMMFIATTLPKVFEGIITTLCIQVHQSSEHLPTYIHAICWALSLSKLLLHSWMCEYWVHFCIQCFRFGKKHFILCMLDSLLVTDTDAAGCGIFPAGRWATKASVDLPSILSFVLHLCHPGLSWTHFCLYFSSNHQMDIIYLRFCQLTLHIVSNLHEELIEGRELMMVATQGLLENEYTGVTFPSNIPNAPAISPQVTLQTTFQVPKARIGKWENILILAGMAIGYRVLTSISLILFQALTLHKHTTSRTSSRPSQDE